MELKINDRLKLIRESKQLSQAKFAKIFSLPQSTYAQYELGGRSVPDDLKAKLYQQGVNINWLVTGEGEMFRDVVDGDGNITIGRTTVNGGTPALLKARRDGSTFFELHPGGLDGKEAGQGGYERYTSLVPMTAQKVSAGTGEEWSEGEVVGMMPIPRSIASIYSGYVLAGATVRGDSMEPTLRDGEPVVYAKGTVEEDGIYVISILDELYVKRLQVDRIGRTVTIISDNKLYQAKTYPMDMEGFSVLGKVVFWLHMEQRRKR